ncbi:hypothetical protein [Pseudonocardia acidicola]|uniref:TrbC/VIRB2 family protein n=1 Tax=Pseudonocardia acidicola TaxID=2724939 RepID=A0ABX1SIJ8_9PSEU|nr:hypothetical protein [Pseudonocardia acidicola]NMI00628.1 hypothetical protein [Pseudonocardia acidicola]
MLAHTLADTAHVVLAQLPPNPTPQAPPGTAGDRINQVVGMVKWAAGISLLVGFFGGVAVFAGGRLVDHHRIGRVGTMMMMSSVAGAILYAVGYTLLSSFASGG